jgi:hypothetical protein
MTEPAQLSTHHQSENMKIAVAPDLDPAETAENELREILAVIRGVASVFDAGAPAPRPVPAGMVRAALALLEHHATGTLERYQRRFPRGS